MEPRRQVKDSNPSRDPRRGQTHAGVPQKDAYARLLSQHHSSKFRSYRDQFAQQLQLDQNGTEASFDLQDLELNSGCQAATGSEAESCLALYMEKLNERGGPAEAPRGKHQQQAAVAGRQHRGERRDTNTSQDGDVESGEEGLLRQRHPKKHRHGEAGPKPPAGGFRGNEASQGALPHKPSPQGGGKEHEKKKSKKKNASKSSEGVRREGAYPDQAIATQPQDGNPDASITPDKSKNKNKSGRGKKNPMFEAYMCVNDVSAGLKRGELIQGQLRINPKKYHEAFIPAPDGMRDIFLDGIVARNRALNGDVVVVKVLPRDQWKVVKSDTDGEGASEPETPLGEQKAGQSPSSDVIVEAQNSDTAEDRPDGVVTQCRDTTEALEGLKLSTTGSSCQKNSDGSTKDKTCNSMNPCAVSDKCLQRTAKVVYIVELKHSRAAMGFLKFLPDKNFAMFSPVDHRVPRVNVPLADCPDYFTSRPGDYVNTLFVCRITHWHDNSTFAEGRLAKSLGQAGEIEPETEGILMEYDVDFSEFSEDVLQCLPHNLPWTIPHEEFCKRRDLRNECIFTIDPATARDLDDALSCKLLPDGNFEVGVHIADVSYFVEEGKALDLVASQRATSVYLVQKVIPMLPRLLCEELCSLNPLTDRLTFSVIWKITPQGKILSEWFGRSVIRSCVKLSYDHAQSMIDAPDKLFSTEELPPFDPRHPIDEIHQAVINLHTIAKNLRSQRFQGGALRLDQLKLSFTLDKESGMPQGCYIYEYRDSNKLVEEFMLLANMAAAHQIYRSFPKQALLRRHPPPQTKMVDDLTEFCDQMGLNLDFSSAGALHRSLNETLGNDQYSSARKEVLTHMCSRPMQMAIYFCTGVLKEEPLFRHYALNVPFYTHFTSPIRRYPDVIVHRLLAASLGCGSHVSLTEEDVQKRASHCNDRKTASKRVQEMSSELFFAAFVKESGPLESEAMVMGVLDQAFDVLVLRYGVQKRIYCNALQGLQSFHYLKVGKKPELTLVWAAEDPEQGSVRQEISIFSLVEVVLKADAAPMKYSAVLKHPKDSTS
ncbi:hypothetical protein SKAU_G00196080 [Synaphobranchus kaupii]|uniref:DIS3-like exonuclease 2 n=1 Tax=Synaphobranchus kaupii TaxID=118154 RepID=A0A9Q1IWU3_SYNKA|nr:hypothetical protein SKAU_G00196080 [Synaphobranchus kaupii]